ncbi:MAG: TonB-dependent receptor plug domain-containing protein [Gemmatimonadota bacterium]
MNLHPSSVLLLAMASLVAASGCTPPATLSGGSPLEATEIITRSRIENSGATTAWEALRLSRTIHLETDIQGRPVGMLNRGQGTISLDDTPLLVVDGARVADIKRLGDMPAEHVYRILIYSGSSATIRWGPEAISGLVEIITTRTRSLSKR